MKKAGTAGELIGMFHEFAGTDITEQEAGMVIEYLKSGDETLAYDEEKERFFLLRPDRAGGAEELEGPEQAVILCMRRAEAVTGAMVMQINIYNNIEDADYIDLIGQDVEILAALADRLKKH